MNSKRHVVVLGLRGIPNLQGGIEQHCEQLYGTIDKALFTITLLARKPYVGMTPYVYQKIRVIPIWAPKIACVETVVHSLLCVIWILIRRRRFDLVHLHGIGPAVFSPILKLWGLKVLVTVHGLDYKRSKFNRFGRALLKLGEYLGATFADRVIAVSKHLTAYFHSQYPTTLTQYIPNGISFPEGLKSTQTIEGFHLTPGRYILAVGRIDPGKGFHDLIMAYRDIDTDWKLVIAGAPDHQNDYSRSLEQMAGACAGVVMTGFQGRSSLQALYANAGLFVLPSYHEGLPIVALEALSFGLPVLLSDIPANREVADTSDLFPAGNPERLRNAMENFLVEVPLAADRHHRQRRKAQIRIQFGWRQISTTTVTAYQDLLKAA